MESILNTQTHACISTSSSLTPQSSERLGHLILSLISSSYPFSQTHAVTHKKKPPTHQPTNQPDPFMLPAAVRSLNYATTPVECRSDVWTNFLHCMTFELLECLCFPLRTCVRAHVCMFVCMSHFVTVCVLCVCPHMFVSVQYHQMCLCTVYTYVKCLWLCGCDWAFGSLLCIGIQTYTCVSLDECVARVRVIESVLCSKCMCVCVCTHVRVFQTWGCVTSLYAQPPMAHTVPCSAL